MLNVRFNEDLGVSVVPNFRNVKSDVLVDNAGIVEFLDDVQRLVDRPNVVLEVRAARDMPSLEPLDDALLVFAPSGGVDTLAYVAESPFCEGALPLVFTVRDKKVKR